MTTTTTEREDTSIHDLATVEGSSDAAPEPPFAFPVHPLAESFPMLEGDELDALVDDIRTNGLLNPIVRDTNGRLIDGRNRLKACALAGVEPRFTTSDVDPVAYILGA